MTFDQIKYNLLFWWPFLVAPAAIAFIGGATWLLWPKEDISGSVKLDPGYGTIEDLTDYDQFRTAYIRANGGAEKLAKLQSVRARGIFSSGGNDVPFFTIKRRPDQSLTTLKFPNYELTFVVNGEQVWQRIEVPGQTPEYSLKVGAEAHGLKQMASFFDPLMRVIALSEGEVLELSAARWDNQPTVRIYFRVPDSEMRAAAYIDPETMQPLARTEEFSDGQVRRIIYGDYQTVGGMLEPFLVETYVDDSLQNRIIIEKSEHNVGTLASIFQYPGEPPDEKPSSARPVEP